MRLPCILAELERIDLLIQVQIQRSRQIQLSNEAFQGLYISEEELEQLLAKPMPFSPQMMVGGSP